MGKNIPSPYQEGSGWAFRLRRGDLDVYRKDYATKAEANQALTDLIADLNKDDKPVRKGPFKTAVGVALSDYARERMPFLKGARQEANRINAYLRTLGLPVIRLGKPAPVLAPVKEAMRDIAEPATVYFSVCFADEGERAIPAGLGKHRSALNAEGARTAASRAKLARTAMADVSASDIQAFVNQMKLECFGASSIRLEVAVLRQLFNHARKKWRWARPVGNPAGALDLPSLGEGRNRVLSETEWSALSVSLARYDVFEGEPAVLADVAEVGGNGAHAAAAACHLDHDLRRAPDYRGFNATPDDGGLAPRKRIQARLGRRFDHAVAGVEQALTPLHQDAIDNRPHTGPTQSWREVIAALA